MKNTSFPECFPHWVFLFKNNKKPTNQKKPRSKSLMKNGNFIPCWWHNHFSSPGSCRLHKEMILLGIREDKTSVKTQKRQQGSGGGRDALWVKSGGNCRLNSPTPPRKRDLGFNPTRKLPAASLTEVCCKAGGGRQLVHLRSQHTSKSAKQW